MVGVDENSFFGGQKAYCAGATCFFFQGGGINPILSLSLSLSIYTYIPGTQMTPVLIEKGLLLEGSTPKTKDKQVRGIYIYIN